MAFNPRIIPMKSKPVSKPKLKSVTSDGILCGTDFSPAAEVAVDVATDFARRLSSPLTLVHAVELPRVLKGDAKASKWLGAVRKRSLREVAEGSRKRGVAVREVVAVGSADDVLVRTAESERPRFVVVSSLGHRSPGNWFLGSVAERTAGRAATPTLVLRKADPIRAWLRGKRSLVKLRKKLVGLPSNPASGHSSLPPQPTTNPTKIPAPVRAAISF